VFVLCSNTAGAVIGYTAFIQHRIVPVLLHAHLDTELLTELMDTYCPVYIWLPEELAGRFQEMDKTYENYGYVLLKTGYKTSYPMHEELGLLLTTSGSTGSPKLVRQSYENVKVNAGQISEYLELTDGERPVTTLPMNYTYGLSIINSHLSVGAKLLLTERGLMDRKFWDFMTEQRATSFGGVPYTYEMLERLRFFEMDLPYLRTMTQAGGKLPPELHRKFAEYAREHGKHFVVMYGACEATARMGYLPPERALEKCGSCGIAIPGGTFYLVDEDGQRIEEPRVAGELVYEGRNVTMGYAQCGADLIRGDERQGRLETGDMAERDADGFYFIVGRKKRFLKIYGNRVNLDETDRLIRAEFPLLDCASTGVDDHMEIFVTDASVSDQIKTFIAAKTNLNPAAFEVHTVEHIPRNDAGKVLYQELPGHGIEDGGHDGIS